MLNNRKTILGFIVSALFLVLIFYNVDLNKLLITLRQFDIKNTLLIVLLYGISLFVRGYRWKLLLESDKKYSLYRLTSIWTIGSLMNAFLPARAGDIWRSCEMGIVAKESKMKLFGSVILERIFDGVSICCILYFCIVSYANLKWIRDFADLSMLLFGGSLLIFYIIVRFDKIDYICKFFINLISKKSSKINSFLISFLNRIEHQIKLFVSGLKILKSTYYIVQVSLMSFVIWGLECIVTYWVLISFGLNCPFSATMFIVCFVALGTMIPSSSIFVGPYQFAYILALGLYWIPKSEALAVAVVQQSILMGALLLFSGLICCINFVLKLKSSKNVGCLAKKDDLLQEVSK